MITAPEETEKTMESIARFPFVQPIRDENVPTDSQENG